MNAISMTTDDLRIRIGIPEDLDELMALSMAACDENGFLNPSPNKLLEIIYPSLLQKGGIVGCIGKPGGIIEGAVLLTIGTMWYSEDPVCEERAIFIHPDFRAAKGGRAKRLCEFSKQVADSIPAPLMIGVVSNTRTEAKLRMYRRVFGEPAGAWFLHNARTDTTDYMKH